MSGAESSRDQVRRLADRVAEVIRGHEDEFLHAEGAASLTIFGGTETSKIELTTSKVVGAGDGRAQSVPRRLSGEIRKLADDVGQALTRDWILVGSARQVRIEIHLRGPRPDFEITYRTYRT